MKSLLIKIGLLAILLFTLSKISLPAKTLDQSLPKNTPVSSPTVKSAVDYKDAPEMAEILGADQEKRLLAGRKLVERVGVEDALEILEHSSLPHTGEGHLVVHQIGFWMEKMMFVLHTTWKIS